MNRLIIIGNGFDLAHGMKTSFNDFISDYLCNLVERLLNDRGYKDPLIQIDILKYDYWDFRSPFENLIVPKNIYQIIEIIKNSEQYELKFISPLLERVYLKCFDLLWVDIEVEYFNILLETKNSHDDSNRSHAIRLINEQLEFLKQELIKYLEIQEKTFSNLSDKKGLIDCFCDEIKNYELTTIKLQKNILPEKLYFLNFNYTNTFEDYYRLCEKKISSDFNYIHGKLSGAHGKPIFGFGDEFDKKYLEFEDEKNNELFKHIKSFEYLQSKNFYLLTRFIESENFQVHIYGHSCGISDRTMLNQIFEHDNCKSIKIYYYRIDETRNDFTDKTYEISRHFKNKTMLRKKLVPFDLSKEMPQPIKHFEPKVE